MQDPKDPERDEVRDPLESTTRTQEYGDSRAALSLPVAQTRHMVVEVVGGPVDGLRRRSSGPSLTIGRGERNDLRLAHDLLVSTEHARIVKEGEHYWLEDLESRNGIYLGDERIRTRALIGPGTLFTVGKTCLEFMPH